MNFFGHRSLKKNATKFSNILLEPQRTKTDNGRTALHSDEVYFKDKRAPSTNSLTYVPEQSSAFCVSRQNVKIDTDDDDTDWMLENTQVGTNVQGLTGLHVELFFRHPAHTLWN